MTPQEIYIKQLEKNLATQLKEKTAMKGYIRYQADRCRWTVVWYIPLEDRENPEKDRVYITKDNGEYMTCTAFKRERGVPLLDKKGRLTPDKEKCKGYERARRLLMRIQNRKEQADRGECAFDIQEFKNGFQTDIVDFYRKWIKEGIEEADRKPSTVHGYKIYLENWIEPFFQDKSIFLHQVDLETTMSFLKFIKKRLREQNQNKGIVDPNSKTGMILEAHRKMPEAGGREISRYLKEKHNLDVTASWCRRTIAKVRKKETENTEKKESHQPNIGKYALNIVSSLSTMMKYAKRCGKIKKLPEFPKLEDYNLKVPKIKWLSKKDSDKVYAAIPEEHRVIFLWLKYHFRREGEACAMRKVDYDPINKTFTVQRAISARQEVDSVKTNWKNPTIHYFPCHPDYIDIADRVYKSNPDSPYFFSNSRSRKHGRYTLEALRNIWYAACEKAGVEKIRPYQGTKHTACTQFMEDGGTKQELQLLTGHKNPKSVEPYAEITLRRIKMAQESAKLRAENEERIAKETETRGQDGDKVIFLFRKDE